MPINTSATSFSIVELDGPDGAPVGSRMELPVLVDQAPPVYTLAPIEDQTKRPMREGNPDDNGHGSVAWTLDMHMRGGSAMDLLLQSAASGRFVANKLLAGETETYFAVSSVIKPGAAGDANVYEDKGFLASGFSLTASAKQGAEISFDLIGLSRNELDTVPAGIVPTPVTAKRMTFKHVSVQIGDEELEFQSIQLDSSQERDALVVLGNAEGKSIYTSGKRNNMFSFAAYREDFNINTLLGTTTDVSVICSTGAGNAYKFTLPLAKCLTTADENDDSGLLVNLEFKGGYDNTTGAGLIIEKL